MGYYSDVQEAKEEKAAERAAASRDRKKASRFRRAASNEKFQGSMKHIPGDLLLQAILTVIQEQACISFSATRDNECLVVTILDGADKVKEHLRSDTAVIDYLAGLAGLDASLWQPPF